MLRYFIILLFILPALLISSEPDTIEVGTFNIEWFPCKDDGEMMKKYDINLRTPPQGNSTNIESLFTLLQDLDLELIGVVEIVDPELLESSAKHYLGESYELIYAPSAGSQKIGFLYDSSVLQLVGQPQVYTDVALGPDTWLRPALRVYLKYRNSGFDFHAIVTHLKASPSGWKKRQKQWAILERILTELPGQTNDSDIVLMGDFNNVSKLKDDEFKPLMKELNFYWATGELQPGGYSNYWKPDYKEERIEGSLIDQIFISADALEEYVKGSVRAGGMCECGEEEYSGIGIPEYYEEISDHCPVYASFRGDIDND